jgi:O-antigen ligase
MERSQGQLLCDLSMSHWAFMGMTSLFHLSELRTEFWFTYKAPLYVILEHAGSSRSAAVVYIQAKLALTKLVT